MLAFGNRRGVDREVQVVGRRVVHDLNVGIVEQRLVAAVGLRHAERLRLLLRRRLAAARNRDDVHEPETPHGVEMMRADESGPDESHADTLQSALLVGLQATGFRLLA